MYEPTHYAEGNIAVDAMIDEEHLPHFGMAMEAIQEYESVLTRLRSEKYLNKESVYDVTSDDVKEFVDFDLPDAQIEDVNSLDLGTWGTIYRLVAYDGMEWEAAYQDQVADDSMYGDTIIFDLDEVKFDDGRVEVPLNGRMTPVYLKGDLEKYADQFEQISVNFNSQEMRQFMNAVADVEMGEITVALLWGFDTPRTYVNPSPDANENAVAELVSGLSPLENPEDAKRVFDGLTDLGYGSDWKIKIGLYIAGVFDTIKLDYGYFTPTFTWHLAQSLGEYTEHIPQTGEILISNDPLDEFSNVANEFPEQQSLDTPTKMQLFQRVGFPTDVAEYYCHDERIDVGRETLARLRSNGMVTATDVAHYSMCPWDGYDEDSVYEAIEFGEMVRSALHNVEEWCGAPYASDVTERVDQGKRVYW